MDNLLRFVPLFRDISTDTAQPPPILSAWDRREELPYPIEKGKLQAFIYSDIRPLPMPLTRDTCFELCRQIAEDFGWELLYEDRAHFRMQWVARTRFFHFEDDVAIEIRSASARGSVVHLRSRSRTGVTDLGTNAKRIKRFLAHLDSKGREGDSLRSREPESGTGGG